MLNLHHVKAYIFYFIIFFGLNDGKIIGAYKQSEIQRTLNNDHQQLTLPQVASLL